MNITNLRKAARSIDSVGVALPLVAVLTLGAASQAQAAPLNLTLLDTPDIAVFEIAVSYTASTDTLDASGLALTLDDDGIGDPEDIIDGSFILDASIDDSGTLIGGTVTITGLVPALGLGGATPLLTGSLTDFGFPAPGDGDLLEFLFSVTGGDAAGLYGGLDSIAGFALSNGTGFPGDFLGDFTGGGTAVTDVAPVPLPAALWLFGAGLLGLVGVARNRDCV
jgi:hypothetical protein